MDQDPLNDFLGKDHVAKILENPGSTKFQKKRALAIIKEYKKIVYTQAYKKPPRDAERAEGYGPNGERIF